MTSGRSHTDRSPWITPHAIAPWTRCSNAGKLSPPTSAGFASSRLPDAPAFKVGSYETVSTHHDLSHGSLTVAQSVELLIARAGRALDTITKAFGTRTDGKADGLPEAPTPEVGDPDRRLTTTTIAMNA